MAEKTVSKADDGTAVDLRVGDVLVVRLAENPTTGYRWQLTASGGLVSESDEFMPASGGGIGAGGERVVRFRAAAAGASQIEGVLRRSWEAADQAADRFRVAIRVS